MKEKVITDNMAEKITVVWNGVTFGIVREDKLPVSPVQRVVLILNPQEMMELVKFADSLGGD